MKPNKKQRYIVEYSEDIGGVGGCQTYQDLQRHLAQNFLPEYRLVSCQYYSGNYTLVWELKD